MRVLAGLASLTMLAACGEDGGSAAAPAGPQPLDAVQNRIVAMTEAERNGVLIRAIRDARRDCQHVETSEALPAAANGAPGFLARCAGGRAYVVGIGRGGTATVTPAGAR